MQLLHRLTKDCNEDEKNYLEKVHERGRNIEAFQRERRAEANSTNLQIENMAKTTKNKSITIGVNQTKKFDTIKDSTMGLKDTTIGSKYGTIKFVRNAEYERDSSEERDLVKDKLNLEANL
jgi:hypothetical protein